MVSAIVELLDKADEQIRKDLEKAGYGTLSVRNALKEAREHVQKAITILLDAH